MGGEGCISGRGALFEAERLYFSRRALLQRGALLQGRKALLQGGGLYYRKYGNFELLKNASVKNAHVCIILKC
jgi:hypothetical protein